MTFIVFIILIGLSGIIMMIASTQYESTVFSVLPDDSKEAIASIGEPYNIGSEVSITIKELAEKIIRITGSESGIQYLDYKTAYGEGYEDMKKRIPNIEKLQNATGFRCEIRPVDALQKIINYFQKNTKYDN